MPIPQLSFENGYQRLEGEENQIEPPWNQSFLGDVVLADQTAQTNQPMLTLKSFV